MPDIAYVQGKWGPLASAKISVEDRGFQFGDGVYELIRTYQGQIFHREDHIRRLYQSARAVQIIPLETATQMHALVQEGCVRSRYENVKIYIQITRGTAPRAHPFPGKDVPATTVCTFREFEPLSQKLRESGVSIIDVEDFRWRRCDVKSLNLLPNVLARQQAIQSSAFEAIFVRGGYVWEGAGSNLFGVFEQTVITPPKCGFVLAGVTRDHVLKLGRRLKIEMREAPLLRSELDHADELFLTGTTLEVLPVVRVNRKRVGSGKPGPITLRLYQAFRQGVERLGT